MQRRAFALVLALCALYTLYAAHDSPALAPYIDIERPLPSVRPAPHARECEHATLGALLVADSDGYVCERFVLLPAARGGCCSPGHARSRYVCADCVPSRGGVCCALYEHCVSCCTGAPNPFHACTEHCRTHSGSLDGAGHYRDAAHRYCFGEQAASETPSASPSASGAPGRPIEWLDI